MTQKEFLVRDIKFRKGKRVGKFTKVKAKTEEEAVRKFTTASFRKEAKARGEPFKRSERTEVTRLKRRVRPSKKKAGIGLGLFR